MKKQIRRENLAERHRDRRESVRLLAKDETRA